MTGRALRIQKNAAVAHNASFRGNCLMGWDVATCPVLPRQCHLVNPGGQSLPTQKLFKVFASSAFSSFS